MFTLSSFLLIIFLSKYQMMMKIRATLLNEHFISYSSVVSTVVYLKSLYLAKSCNSSDQWLDNLPISLVNILAKDVAFSPLLEKLFPSPTFSRADFGQTRAQSKKIIGGNMKNGSKWSKNRENWENQGKNQ